MAKAKVFLVFDEDGFPLRTRVITQYQSVYRGVGDIPFPEIGLQSCFMRNESNLTPEHQAEDYDLENNLTSVLVATIDI